jgi:hypothetical protein
MTALIQQQAKYEDEGYSIAKYKHLQTNSDTGQVYRHYPTIKGEEHRFLKIAPPSEDIREAYEQKKQEYNDQLNRELLEELLEEKRDDDEDEKNPQAIAEDILESGLGDYVKENNGQRYISRDLIELDYDLGSGRSKKVKAAIERDAPDDVLQRHLEPNEVSA